MKVNRTYQIVGLRLAVGLLGEQEQSAWWPSSFLGRHAPAFLNPIFGSKTRMAQYNGITEAACRIHDEKIGVGRVFHLYRLPETIEQRISNAYQEGGFPDDVARCFDSKEVAESILASLAKGPSAAKPDRQSDVLALELVVDHSPIGLGPAAMALLGADRGEECRLQCAIGHLSRQRPAEPGIGQSL